jgi:hypothetical protein
MKLYVYCLCADLDSFDKPVSGVSGAAVRVLKIDDLSVLVSDCETVAATQENALAHAAVVRSVLDRMTPLPFRFGTLATEQQLRSFITTHKIALANKLAHVRGCVEMDLKVIWQRSGTNASEPVQATGPGTAFLKEKQRELVGDEQAAAQRAELSRLLHKELGSLIKDESMGLRPSEGVVLAAVFHLVESAKIQQYREKMAEVFQQRPDLEFRVSGPWPPYSFANIELEFPSRFGVS